MPKHNINWTSLALEFLVVLIGILLAFQLNECSGRKKSNKLIDRHIDAIEEETVFNKLMLTQASDSLSRSIKKIEKLLESIEKEDLITANKLSLECLASPTLFVKKNAYNTLKESGDIRLMEDFEKKNYIIYLYSYYDWAKELDKIEIEGRNRDFYPYMNQHFDFIKSKAPSLNVFKNQGFKNALASILYLQYARKAKYDECIGIIEKYLAK